MFEFGASLEEARRRQGLSLEQVEKEILIRQRYLRALEEERFEVLPGDAYAKGFVRTYAAFLGLDPDRYVGEYSARFAGQAPPPLVANRPRIRAQPRIRLWRWPLVAGVAGAALVGVLAWQYGGSPSQPRTLPPPKAPRPPRAKPVAPPKPTPKPKPAPKPVAPKPPPVLSLNAVRGPCWVDVHAFTAAGRQVYAGVLARGGTLRFSLRRPLWIRLGAPQNLDATIAGRPTAGLPTQTANILVTRAGVRPA